MSLSTKFDLFLAVLSFKTSDCCCYSPVSYYLGLVAAIRPHIGLIVRVAVKHIPSAKGGAGWRRC